jgi:AraC-like DNA-binding protein
VTDVSLHDDRPWRFDTADLAAEARNDAWRDAMHRLRLPFVGLIDDRPVDGRIIVAHSPLDIRFAVVEADAQLISGRSEISPAGGVWLSIMLAGTGVMRSPGFEAPFGRDQILFGMTRTASTLQLDGRHCQLFVNIPQIAIGPRLLAPLDTPVAMLHCREGMAAIFYRLLEATAEQLGQLGPEQLRPVELAVVEFLVHTLAARSTRSRGGAEGARASLLYRIRQRMEAMLGEPELDVEMVAADAGISPRYLRRLFTAEHEHFGTYLKARRLERCFADLASPLHAQLGISEIAFRWGFNDAAHFSRSFRSRFGLTPREHRRNADAETQS